jgi:signal recognition particle GTPase
MGLMIDSMTSDERRHPEIIDWRRRRRIAEGSGCDQKDVASARATKAALAFWMIVTGLKPCASRARAFSPKTGEAPSRFFAITGRVGQY